MKSSIPVRRERFRLGYYKYANGTGIEYCFSRERSRDQRLLRGGNLAITRANPSVFRAETKRIVPLEAGIVARNGIRAVLARVSRPRIPSAPFAFPLFIFRRDSRYDCVVQRTRR